MSSTPDCLPFQILLGWDMPLLGICPEGFWISYVDDGHEWDSCQQAPPPKKKVEGDGFIEDGHQLLVGLYDPS